MLSDDSGNSPEGRTAISVSFGIRGDSLVPAEISMLLGVQASYAFTKGEEYQSAAGRLRRPWGVWQLRSDSSVTSADVVDHVQFILEQLEPRKDIIKQYIERDDMYVDVRIYCESCVETISFAVSSNGFTRLADLCNEFNFSFIASGSSEN